MVTYWLKIVYFSYLTLIRHPRSIPLEYRGKLTTIKLESWGYSVVKVA